MCVVYFVEYFTIHANMWDSSKSVLSFSKSWSNKHPNYWAVWNYDKQTFSYRWTVFYLYLDHIFNDYFGNYFSSCLLMSSDVNWKLLSSVINKFACNAKPWILENILYWCLLFLLNTWIQHAIFKCAYDIHTIWSYPSLLVSFLKLTNNDF